jgi:hypothetical protein
MTLDELREWHFNKAKRHAMLAANVKATTAGEAHRRRSELQRQAEFHSDAVYAIDAARGVNAPVSTDAAWVQRIRETAAHLRDNSLKLAKYPGMDKEARARELAALYIQEIADLHEVKRAFGVGVAPLSVPDKAQP